MFVIAAILMMAALPAQAQLDSYQEENPEVLYNKNFRFAIGGGYAFRLGKVAKTGDSRIDELNAKLRHGFTVDADAQYFFKEKWGLGLNANFCSSNTSGSNIDVPELEGTVGSYKETQNMFFIGPSFAGRDEWNKFQMIYTAALGPLFFTDNGTFDGIVVNGKATTVALNAGVAGEYKLNASTAIGLKLSYTIGTINSLNVKGQKIEAEEAMSVSNLMLTGFISFRTR